MPLCRRTLRCDWVPAYTDPYWSYVPLALFFPVADWWSPPLCSLFVPPPLSTIIRLPINQETVLISLLFHLHKYTSQKVYNVRLIMSYVLSPPTLFPASHANTPTTPSLSPSPSPNAEHLLRPSSNGLLIPTDRTQDVLETKWLGMLGRLRVEREVILKGYALYSLRTW